MIYCLYALVKVGSTFNLPVQDGELYVLRPPIIIVFQLFFYDEPAC